LLRINRRVPLSYLRLALSALALAFLVLALRPGTTVAAGNYLFDPTLSLSGFSSARAVTTDPFGDIYVVDNGPESAEGSEGSIDVFTPSGSLITKVEDASGPRNVAVDSKGYLYVFAFLPGSNGKVERYTPSAYNPAIGEIAYGSTPVVIREGDLGFFAGLAINRANDHLFVHVGTKLVEYTSATEGNALVPEAVGAGAFVENQGLGLAVDAAHGRIYASDSEAAQGGPLLIRVFNLSPPHEEFEPIKGNVIPSGSFANEPSLAVDEATGNVFVYFNAGKKTAVYELTEDGDFVTSIEHQFKYPLGAEIGVDSGVSSPNEGYLFVPSAGEANIGEVLAFGPSEVCLPEIEESSFANVTTDEAELRATINPCGGATHYIFEFTTQQAFEAAGFEGAQLAGQGELPAAKTSQPVSGFATGLAPGTAYRFRVRAENEVGPTAAEGTFTTYSATVPGSPCPNDALRTGLAALLPDCRAYELVTPAETNARAPRAFGFASNPQFATRQASPSGDAVSFVTEGGTIPGYEGTGWLSGDPYRTTREANGWSTVSTGPNGVEASVAGPGSTSPDQNFSFWTPEGEGTALVNGKRTTYVRYPDGSSELVGRGSLNIDSQARGKLISENGGHIIFTSGEAGHPGGIRLEPDAPQNGTRAVYDRTSDEVTHVVSLLPGNKTPKAGEDASYVGASLDGRGVAFTIGGTLYLRRDDTQSFEIGSGLTFAGVAEGGGRIFYLQAGNLKAFDAQSGKTIVFAEGGDVTPVNIPAEGTAAYFVSPDVLTTKVNPNGAKAKTGNENLYLSREGQIGFVGTVTERDVKGEPGLVGQMDGLGLWLEAVGPDSAEVSGRPAVDPSRVTPAGSVLLFQSRAPLDGYDSEGHSEVYRYDSAGSLDCLSCNPTGSPASGEGTLQTPLPEPGDPAPTVIYSLLPNLRDDGHRAFFQSTEPLVVGDTDHLQDVYEWEAQGVGSCDRAGGCIYLISAGNSGHADYLYSVSASGDDVFFSSADQLLGSDRESTYSIYDARVGGGFPEATEEECQGEGCRPGIAPTPDLVPPASPALGAKDNVSPRCPKGKRKVKRHGKIRCVKKKGHGKHHRHKAAANQKGGSK